MVFAEKVHMMPAAGYANFSLGGSAKGLEVACAIFGLRLYLIQPRKWQVHVLGKSTRGRKGKSLKARRKFAELRKSLLLDKAREWYPTLPLTFKADSGIADAALIARSGRVFYTIPA